MILPKTYRARLIIYSLLLISFLISTMIFTYHHSRSVVLEEARDNLSNAVSMHNNYLTKDIQSIRNHAKLIANNQRLKEYLNLANLNGDTGPLHRLLQQTFSWLPADRKVVISRHGHLLIGAEHHRLASEVQKNAPWDGLSKTFYLQRNSLELVAVEPVLYRGEIIGAIALGYSLQHNWREWHQQNKGGDIFMVQDGQIVFSTSSQLVGLPFKSTGDYVPLGADVYRAYPVTLPNQTRSIPTLWYGQSETQLLNALVDQRQQLIILIVLGTIATLLVGLAIVHSFNRPLSRLMALTEEVANGNLPDVAKTKVHTEIDVLSNNFSMMVESLKEKQAQVDQAHDELKRSAITDTLTGLYNRRHLQDIYPKLQAHAKREQRTITASLFDLDYFKRLNDRYGHLAGDKALVQFAQILKRHSRGGDFLYRMGGEEFLILSIGKDSHGGAVLAEKIRIATSKVPVKYKNHVIDVTVSCGLSHSHGDEAPEASLNHLLSRADKALYAAKERGRNQICTYENMVADEIDPPPTLIRKKRHMRLVASQQKKNTNKQTEPTE